MKPAIERRLTRITTKFQVDENGLLGQGKFGQVFLGYKSDQRIDVAVKIFTKEKVAQFGPLFQREVQILQALKPKNHKNLVRYYGHAEANKKMYLFFELCKSNLTEKLSEKRLQQQTIKQYFKDIMDGLVELHSCNILHRDLKPDNILVCSQGRLKLADFGLSRLIDPQEQIKLTMTVGSMAFRSPETFRNQHYDSRSDVWSAGLVLYRMLADCFCREFQLKTEIDVKKRNQALQKGKLNLSFEGFQPIWECLLRKMLICDPLKRANSKEILEQFQAWNDRPLFSGFRQQKAIAQQEETKPIQLSPQNEKKNQDILIQEVSSSLRDEESCKNLLEYLQYLNYYNELKRYSEQNQDKLLYFAAKNPQLKTKYPNFLILSSYFLAKSMIFLRFSTILDEITLVNYQKVLQESQLNQFEIQRYNLLRNMKLAKFGEFVKLYNDDFKKDTTKLLSYSQRQGMSKFSLIFQVIAQFLKDKHKLTFIKVYNLFDELYSGIDFKQSLNNLTDSEIRIMYLLKTLKEISVRFSKGYHPLISEEKIILKKSLESLDLETIRKDLSD